jgi:queuine tRNA-ribosyltransferase
LLGQVLLSWHNLAYYQHLMQRLRDAIAVQKLDDLRAAFRARLTPEVED